MNRELDPQYAPALLVRQCRHYPDLPGLDEPVHLVLKGGLAAGHWRGEERRNGVDVREDVGQVRLVEQSLCCI